jgi:transmembrane sensor
MPTHAPDHGHNPENANVAALEQVATEWFFRRDRGFSSTDENEFERWLNADVRNVAAFAEIESSWSAFGRLSERTTRNAAVARSSRATIAGTAEKIFWLRPALVAAAAAMVLGLFVWQRPAPSAMPVVEVVSAESGTVRSMNLADGSAVQLNADSAIEIRFSASERAVRLVRGEAHFTVMKNPARPFIVTAGTVAVRAVGTAFNVKLRSDACEVLVTEGTVKVGPHSSPAGAGASGDAAATAPAAADAWSKQPALGVGEMAVILLRGQSDSEAAAPITVLTVPPAHVEQALAWQKRKLEYVDASLADIVAEFNRYNMHQLIIADDKLARQRFGGTFPASDYESLVRLLESTFGVIADRREKDTILRLP